MVFISYAQNFEDVMLWRALGHVTEGRYVDVGAQDPTVDSVSRAFYDAGWHGLHVEPSPDYATQLREQRPGDTVVEAAVASRTGELAFYVVPGSGLSTASAEIADFLREHHGHDPAEMNVAAVTLDGILADMGGDPIHWLKIDVEGFEGEVLRGWESSPQRPWVIVIESTFPTTDRPVHAEWESLVLAKGYTLVYTDGLNRFYLHDSHRDLAEKFRYPPNVFDNFQLSGTATSLTAHIVWRHELALQELERERDQLRSALAEMSADSDGARQAMEQAAAERSAIVTEAVEQLRAAGTEEDERRSLMMFDHLHHLDQRLDALSQQFLLQANVMRAEMTSWAQAGDRTIEEVKSAYALREEEWTRVKVTLEQALVCETAMREAQYQEMSVLKSEYEERLEELRIASAAALEATRMEQDAFRSDIRTRDHAIQNLAREVSDSLLNNGVWLGAKRRGHLRALLGQIEGLAHP